MSWSRGLVCINNQIRNLIWVALFLQGWVTLAYAQMPGLHSNWRGQGSIFPIHAQGPLCADGLVSSTDTNSNYIYIAGTFTAIGKCVGSALSLDISNPRLGSISGASSLPTITGSVQRVISDNMGGWYIAGSSFYINSVNYNGVVHISSAGSLDPSFVATVDGDVYALHLDGLKIFVGGSFTVVNGKARQYFAALDALTGATLNMALDADWYVDSVNSDNGVLYVGGQFSKIGGDGNQIHEVNAGTYSENLNLPAIVGPVHASVSDGNGGWYVGGEFTSVGGVSRTGLVHILSDSSVDLSFAPVLFEPESLIVRSLALSGGTLWVGGRFTLVNDEFRPYLVALNAVTGATLSPEPCPSGEVSSLSLDGSDLLLGGSLTGIGNSLCSGSLTAIDSSTAASLSGFPRFGGTVYDTVSDGNSGWYVGGLFKVKDSNGNTLKNLVHVLSDKSIDPSWAPNPDHTVEHLLLNGTELYVSGSFGVIGGQYRPYLAAISAATGAATSWNPVFNGTINSMVIYGGNLYFAGGTYLGVRTAFATGGGFRNGLGSISLTTGQLNSWNPNVSGNVFALAISGTTLYAGGDFTSAGGTSRNRLVSYDLTTGNRTTWNPGADDTVKSLVVSGGVLYVGGDFTTISGQSRNRLASFATASNLIATWNPSADSSVQTIAVSGTTVYVGGLFENVGGQTRSKIAALDASTGSALSWNPGWNGSQLNHLFYDSSIVFTGGFGTSTLMNPISSIARIDASTGAIKSWNAAVSGTASSIDVSGSKIYLGGSFDGGASQVVVLNSSDGSVDHSWAVNSGGTVNSVSVDGSKLYVGGLFSDFNATSRSNFAVVNLTTSNVDALDLAPDGEVKLIENNGASLFVSGSFNNIGGEARQSFAEVVIASGLVSAWNSQMISWVDTVSFQGSEVFIGGSGFLGQSAAGIAAVNISDGSKVSGFNPDWTGSVSDIEIASSNLYLAGSNFTIGGNSQTGLLKIDKATGVAIPWNPKLDGPGSSVQLSGSVLYVGGSFTTVGATTRNGLAAIDVSAATATSWDPQLPAGSYVNDLLLSGSSLYVGGKFTQSGSLDRLNFVELATGSASVLKLNPSLTDAVDSIALSGTSLAIVGRFSGAGAQLRNRLAAIDLLSGGLTSWNPNANNEVKVVKLIGSSVYVGGDFTQIGGVTRNRIASIAAQSGALDSWNPSANGTVRAIETDGNNIYVGGEFTTISSTSRNYLAMYNASTKAFNSSWVPSANAFVGSLAVYGNRLYISGNFSTVGGSSRRSVAAIDLSTGTGSVDSWNPGPDPVNQSIRLKLVGSDLYIFGTFNTISGSTRNHLAVFDANSGSLQSWKPSPDLQWSEGNTNIDGIAVSNGRTILTGGIIFENEVASNGVVKPFVALDSATGANLNWSPSYYYHNILSTENIVSGGSGVFILSEDFAHFNGQPRSGFVILSASSLLLR